MLILRILLGSFFCIGYSATGNGQEKRVSTAMIEAIQDKIDEAPRLDGCLITGAHLDSVTTPDTNYFVLEGLIVDVGQRDMIEINARIVLESNTIWKAWITARDNHVLVSELVVRPVNIRKGSDFFNEGLQTFLQQLRRDGRNPPNNVGIKAYESSYLAFSHALRHKAAYPKYAYWRVLSALYMKREDRARDLVRILSARGVRAGIPYGGMERVQGKLRLKFEKLVKSGGR